MQCKSCGFVVPQNLKFSIMKNFCAQCGEKLFTDTEMNHISLIQSRVLKQDFSSDMDEQEVHDVSLFIYNEIGNGYGRILIDEELKKIISASKDNIGDPEIDVSESDIDIKKLKAQIREEEADRVALESRQGSSSEDADDKVNRLKNILKNNPIKQKNKLVRRIDS